VNSRGFATILLPPSPEQDVERLCYVSEGEISERGGMERAIWWEGKRGVCFLTVLTPPISSGGWRRWGGKSGVAITTHSEAGKVADVLSNPNVELVYYGSKSWEQMRLRGR
jgi:hypothetical protein